MVNQQPTNNQTTTQTTNNDENTVVSLIPVDSLLHTDAHLYCFNADCWCKRHAIAVLHQAVIDGLATPDDATRIMQGKTI